MSPYQSASTRKMAAKEDVQENNENDSSSISPNKPIILLVEDNTEFRNFLKEELNNGIK